MKKSDNPIIIEQFFNTTIKTVWNAITNIKEMKRWYFNNIPDFKVEVGFKTQFNVSSGKRNFLHLWEIVNVIPYKLLKYNWKYENYNGDSNVSFELIEKEEGTQLILTVEILEDYQEDIIEFKRESCIEGWNYLIKNNLKEYLEGNSDL